MTTPAEDTPESRWQDAQDAYRNAEPGYRLQRLKALQRAANAALRASVREAPCDTEADPASNCYPMPAVEEWRGTKNK